MSFVPKRDRTAGVLAGLRRRLTYANVVSTACLFVLLGGAAYASGVLSKNSVGPRQLRKNAVTSAKVKDASLLAQDFKAGQLPAGPAGPAGKDGAPGSARAYGYVLADGSLDTARSKNLTVSKITGQLGAYCVRPASGSGIDPNSELPVVSASLSSGVGSIHLAQVGGATFYPAQCPASAGWEIYTLGESGSQFVNTDTGFSILVP